MESLKKDIREKYFIDIEKAVPALLDEVEAISKKHKFTMDQALMALNILETRRANTIMLDDNNTRDEQIYEVGKAISRIDTVAQNISEKSEQ